MAEAELTAVRLLGPRNTSDLGFFAQRLGKPQPLPGAFVALPPSGSFEGAFLPRYRNRWTQKSIWTLSHSLNGRV